MYAAGLGGAKARLSLPSRRPRVPWLHL